ncbi:hypothetical protein MRX96_002503 [Rhipicephalus microplus]
MARFETSCEVPVNPSVLKGTFSAAPPPGGSVAQGAADDAARAARAERAAAAGRSSMSQSVGGVGPGRCVSPTKRQRMRSSA